LCGKIQNGSDKVIAIKCQPSVFGKHVTVTRSMKEKSVLVFCEVEIYGHFIE